jgi:hypothetical protein
MTPNNYAVFILSYGRPDGIVTIPTLKKCGYDGPIYIVVDDKDKTLEQYQENYPDNLIVFSKDELKGSFDIMDSSDDDRCVVFARNKVYDLAREKGLDYFIVLDDDYKQFCYRFDGNYKYITATKPIKNITKIFEAMIEYIANSPVKCVSFAQGGDFIGGKDGGMADAVKTKRKAMNLFVFDVNRPLEFTGRINEDVNMYVRQGIIGDIVLTTTQLSLEQATTQKNKGGLTDIYLAKGTYVKSFYSVMASPSSVKINLMGNKHKRLHHIINWRNTVPKIIEEKHKKSYNSVGIG